MSDEQPPTDPRNAKGGGEANGDNAEATETEPSQADAMGVQESLHRVSAQLQTGGEAFSAALGTLASRIRGALQARGITVGEEGVVGKLVHHGKLDLSPLREQSPVPGDEVSSPEPTEPVEDPKDAVPFAQVVSLAAERARRQGAQLNLGTELKSRLVAFAREKAPEAITGEPPTLTIDGAFLKQHGSAVMPLMMGSMAELFSGAVRGNAATDASEDGEAAVPAPEVQIRFDATSLLALFLGSGTRGPVSPAQDKPASAAPEDDGDRE